jgi:hypothetical protein
MVTNRFDMILVVGGGRVAVRVRRGKGVNSVRAGTVGDADRTLRSASSTATE